MWDESKAIGLPAGSAAYEQDFPPTIRQNARAVFEWRIRGGIRVL